MPTNFMEWLGVVASVTTIVAFVMYLRERCTLLRERHERREQDNFMLGFLHGIKPMVAGAAQRDSAWEEFVQQINDALSRLQPPKGNG